MRKDGKKSWVFCDVKTHKYILYSFPGRLEISPVAGVRSTYHKFVNQLHIWVILRRCYYIEHTECPCDGIFDECYQHVCKSDAIFDYIQYDLVK